VSYLSKTNKYYDDEYDTFDNNNNLLDKNPNLCINYNNNMLLCIGYNTIANRSVVIKVFIIFHFHSYLKRRYRKL